MTIYKNKQDTVANVKDFVRIWVQAHKERRTRKWIGEQLGISRQQTYNRYHNLKKHGVDLPPLPKDYMEREEVDEVNRWVKDQLK